jgi:hypothetical protein
MIKKLLFTFLFLSSLIIYSQEKVVENLTAAPNPFSHSTTITFETKNNSKIIFSVKNVLGKTVYKEIIKTKTGKNKIPFSKGNLKTGIYIYTLQSKEKIISKRFVIK